MIWQSIYLRKHIKTATHKHNCSIKKTAFFNILQKCFGVIKQSCIDPNLLLFPSSCLSF